MVYGEGAGGVMGAFGGVVRGLDGVMRALMVW